nr:CO(2)-response secreted protease-like [Ipomoea batatas]
MNEIQFSSLILCNSLLPYPFFCNTLPPFLQYSTIFFSVILPLTLRSSHLRKSNAAAQPLSSSEEDAAAQPLCFGFRNWPECACFNDQGIGPIPTGWKGLISILQIVIGNNVIM